MKSTVLKTTGYITIAVGVYLVYKGLEMEGFESLRDFEIQDDVIDVDFEIIED